MRKVGVRVKENVSLPFLFSDISSLFPFGVSFLLLALPVEGRGFAPPRGVSGQGMR